MARLALPAGPPYLTELTLLVAEWDRSWVVRNHIGNRSYYNPAVTYTPWAGSKSDGSPMYTRRRSDQGSSKDPDDPGGEKVDLTARHSYTSNNISIPARM